MSSAEQWLSATWTRVTATIAILLHIVACQAPDSLRLVNVLYHHGDRSPLRTYPTDPYQESAWPHGFGQLTEIGMLQQRDLGVFLRDRYRDFLNKSYHVHEIYVRSLDTDRALSSAYCVLSGLFPTPEGHAASGGGLTWQPVPVHTVGLQQDHLLGSPDRSCFTASEVDESEHQLQIHDNYQGLIESLRNYTKLNDEMEIVEVVADALYCEEQHNMSLPTWAREALPVLREHVIPDMLTRRYSSDTHRRRTGGALLGKIIQDMMRSESRQLNGMKMMMYSAHDSNVMGLLAALRLFSGHPLPYSSAVLVELHQINETHFVNIWLRNASRDGLHQLTLPGCDANCPLSQFVELTKDTSLPGVAACSILNLFPVGQLATVLVISLSSGLVVLICLLAVTSFCCPRRTRLPPKRYRKMFSEVVPEQVPMMGSGMGSDCED